MNISCLRIKNNYLSAWRRTEDYTGISGTEIAEAGQYGLSILPAENSYQYKYNGKELQEELGLLWYDYGARYYDPRISIFLSVDPLAEKTMDPYGYCYQNPINLVDPTGMAPELESNDLPDNIYKINKDGQIELIEKNDDLFDIVYGINYNENLDVNKSLRYDKATKDSDTPISDLALTGQTKLDSSDKSAEMLAFLTDNVKFGNII